MPRSACAPAQADQGLRCPLTESLDIVDDMVLMRLYECTGWTDSTNFEYARRCFLELAQLVVSERSYTIEHLSIGANPITLDV